MKKINLLMGISCVGLSLASGCGKGGNSVEVTSDSFATSGAAALSATATDPNAISTNVKEFKFCVRKITLEDLDGVDSDKDNSGNDDSESGDDDHHKHIEFTPGLIDASSGEPKSWGKVEVPAGFKLSRIKVKVQKHAQSCDGADYSIKFNEFSEVRDVDFRFRFNPPVELEANDKVKLSLESVVNAIRKAADAGALNKIKDYVESVEGTATKE